MAKEKERVKGEALARAKVEEAGNGRKSILHLLSRLPSTANTVEKETTQRRTVGRSKRMTRNNKKTEMHNSKHHSKVNRLTASRPRSNFRSLRRSLHLHRRQHQIPLLRQQYLKSKEATKRRGSCFHGEVPSQAVQEARDSTQDPSGRTEVEGWNLGKEALRVPGLNGGAKVSWVTRHGRQ